MDNQDTNHVNMIRTTNQYCTDNTAATAAMAAFAPQLTLSKAKLLLIDQLDQIAIATTKGVTLDTKALRKSMTTIALKCASAVHAYAASVNNNTLKAKVNYSQTKLDRLKKEEIDDVCQTIRDVTNTNIANAQNYGVIPADVTTLQSTINVYRIGTQNPRLAIITKSDAKKQIKKLIREIIDLIFKEQMDKMALTRKDTNPTFVNKYFGAREIIDLGHTNPPTLFTIAPNGFIQVDNIPPAAPLNNTGTTLLTFSKTGTPGLSIQVPAGTSVPIPSGFEPSITVHNESPTTAGKFSIQQQ